jgi:hypothetical protein
VQPVRVLVTALVAMTVLYGELDDPPIALPPPPPEIDLHRVITPRGDPVLSPPHLGIA